MAISEAILLSSENKLYGRSQHVAAMLEALDRINRGAGEIVLLPGLSGTGKTTLAETLRKPVVASNGYFLVGKFNQYDRNIPFVAWQQALAQFCDLLLRDDEVQRSQMVADILEAVGSNGQLLLDLVPEFARLIGTQPPLAVISPQEAQHRFAGLVRNVLQAICRPEHPLVLFLDDWQWADAASVRLLDHLQIGSSLRYLLVLAAYRKDEIEFNPSWQEMLQDLQSQSVPITTVGVENLSMEDLRRLVAASVSASPEALDALTVRIHDRTSGNPFFSHALLKLLGEYEFQLQTSSGQERTAAILQHLPDDVVEIYSRRIATLDPITQEVLSLAACLGHRFSLHELAIISNLRLADCEQLLLHFAQDLIVPLTETPDAAGKRPHGKSFFRFAHDRVQQAAYARIAPNDLPGVRLTLARRLIAQLSPDQFSDRVCEIAAHFNAGMELITAIEERLQGVALNVAAARKARSATAFRDALQYHRAASRLLDSQEIQERLWRDLHELGMAICTEQAETEFLEGDIEEAARCIRRAVANALTPLEKAEALSNLVIQYTLRANYAQAIATGREALAALGVILPESDFDTARDVEIAEIKRLVAGRSLDDLLSLPEATDATMRTVAKVLITMGPPCYRSHQQLWSVVVPKVVQLTLQYGHIPQIGYSHTAFAGLLAWVSDDFETGKLFSELANKLMESNLASPSDKSVYHLMVGSSVRHWFNHMALSSQEYDAAFAIGSESGNLQYAAYAFGHNMYCRFFQGAPLETLVRETNSSLAFSRTRRNQWAIDLLEGGLRIFASLTDPVLVTSEGPGAEQAYLHNVVLHQNLQVACIYRVLKVHELILLGDYARARTWSDSAEATISTVGTQGLLPWAEHVFCRLLLLTINSGTATPSAVSDASRGEVAALLKQVQVWSEHNPTNFRHKHLLARAEIERHGNHPWESVSLYDAAIDAALEGGFLQWAAFANERLADFWRSRGSIELAQTYWQQAYLLFDEWGATTKLEAMESAYEKRLEQTTFAPSVDPSGRNQPSATLRSLVSHRFIQQMRQQARMMARARAQSDTAKTAEELAHAAQFLRVNLVERRLEAAKLQQQRDSERVLNDELERRVLERTAELSRAEARFRAVMESAPVAMVMIDREGRIVLLNSELEKLFGYQRDELVGKTVETLVPYRFRLAHTDLRTGFFEHPEARRMGEGRELFGLRKDASEFPVEIGLRPLQADDEPYVLAAILDITDRRLALKALIAAKEEAEAANLAKSEFLANMSHEIRTPMNGILGMTRLAMDAALTPQQREQLTIAYRSAESLLKILNDILDFSKIEAGKIVLDAVPFSLRECVQAVITDTQLDASAKQLQLSGEVAANIPDKLIGDPGRLRQVLLNLISNGIKFTQQGGVGLSVSMVSHGRSEAGLQFAVQDTGIGISAENLLRIFNAFEQADSSITRTHGGTGLGLTISSQFVSMMGGRLEVTSTPGAGSRFQFSVTFPLAEETSHRALVNASSPAAFAQHQANPLSGLPSIAPCRILLVEDNQINQKVAMGILGAAGHEITLASDGREAIEAIQLQRFDVILMDLQMPEMDGFEATARIRQMEHHEGRRTPIIALTAHAMKGDEERCLAAGMDAYLCKPIAPDQLLFAINHCVSTFEQAAPEKRKEAKTGSTCLDRETLLARVGGNVELLREIIQISPDEIRRLHRDLERAVEAQDARSVAVIAHTLKGALGNLNAANAAEAARQLEQHGRAGNLLDATDALRALETELEQLLEALAAFHQELSQP